MSAPLASPSQMFGPLYPRLGEEAKAFADSIPRTAPEIILDQFAADPPQTPTDLQRFIARWFIPPRDVEPVAPASADRTLREHIDALWPALTRRAMRVEPYSSLLPLPHPYLVPGGMFRECYYWDTYFTLVGLPDSQRQRAVESVDNLAFLIDRYGFAPNANRSYYLTRSHPPVFYAAVAALAPDAPARAFARYLRQLKREHAYWMAGEERLAPGQAARSVVRLPDGAALNRYWDEADTPRDEAFARDCRLAAGNPQRAAPDLFRDIRAGCATGWDFSSRWFADRASLGAIITTSILPVDLNSLLYGLERAIAEGAAEAGETPLAQAFQGRAEARAEAMRAHLWNQTLGLYDDYDWRAGALRGAITPACLFPLFAGLARAQEATRTASVVRERLLAPGGLVTSTHATGQQWDAPNGWAPLQWIAVLGLARYGHDALAYDIAERWLAMVARVFTATGRLVEKYDVVASEPGGGGEYPLQDGFGWTNGVTAALLDRFPALARHGAARRA